MLTTDQVREQFASVAYSDVYYESYVIQFNEWLETEIQTAIRRDRSRHAPDPIPNVEFSTYGWPCSTAPEYREEK